jgi:hypothetical protein
MNLFHIHLVLYFINIIKRLYFKLDLSLIIKLNNLNDILVANLKNKILVPFFSKTI